MKIIKNKNILNNLISKYSKKQNEQTQLGDHNLKSK